MLPVVLRPDDLQLGRSETIADTARSLSTYCAAIVIRTFAQQTVNEFAEYSTVPVINALTDQHHPCQALVDLMTLRERLGTLAGRRLAFVGDGNNNVTHSLMEGSALSGMHMTVASPPGYEPDPDVTAAAARLASEHGGRIDLRHRPSRGGSGY
jgi:ornithine carbamoyltransferase